MRIRHFESIFRIDEVIPSHVYMASFFDGCYDIL